MSPEEDTIVKDLLKSLKASNPYCTYLSQSTLSNVTEWIDTGSRMLNAVISGSMSGGIPKGRVTLLAGESSTGKSLIAQKVIGNAQRMGLKVVLFDTENAVDARMSRSLGANPDDIIYYPAYSIEKMRNAIYDFMKKLEASKLHGKFLVVIDSLANVLSEMEEKRMGDDSSSADMGTFAKAIKSLLKTCVVMGAHTGTTFLITNHIYDNPNERYPNLVKCMSGGKACRYLPSVVVQLAKKNLKADDAGEEDTGALSKGITGIEMRCMCVKNRFIRPMVEGAIYLSWKNGLDEEYGTFDLAKELGVIKRTGVTYELWNGEKLGYAKVLLKNKQLWKDVIYPELERRVSANWAYSNDSEHFDEDEMEKRLLDEIEKAGV